MEIAKLAGSEWTIEGVPVFRGGCRGLPVCRTEPQERGPGSGRGQLQGESPAQSKAGRS